MRLIDGDALIAECENAICPTASGRMVLRSVIRTIKKTPTAYDPDKVVEQIKELSIREFGEIKTEDVIAIVRGGGADAD